MSRTAAVSAPLPLDVRLMNRLTLVLALVFAGLVLAAAVAAVQRLDRFNLQAIRVEGELHHNNAVTLRANVAPKLTGNFFTLDLAQAKAAFEAVPWVRQAVVRREFPNRLRVQLEEHQPVAFWGLNDEARLVNAQGEVFEVNEGDMEAEDLPRLAGPATQAAEVLRAYRRLSPLFTPLDATLEQLELSGRGSWRAVLDTGAVIELGGGPVEALELRTHRFVTTVAQTSSRYGRNIESADLRYPNGYALRLRGVTTVSNTHKTQPSTR